MAWNELISAFFLLSGVLFILIANLGILIMPDVLCRSHALSKAVTLGILLMLMGLWTYLGSEAVGLKILLAILFQFITIPLSSHLFVFYTSRHLAKNKKMDH